MAAQTSLPHPPPSGIAFHRQFDKKDWLKLEHDKFRQKFLDKTLPAFQKNPFNKDLNNHAVGAAYTDCRSINVTGDVRALYMMVGGVATFVRIGTHSQLYG